MPRRPADNGAFMDTNRIIADIDTEISKLQQVTSDLDKRRSQERPWPAQIHRA